MTDALIWILIVAYLFVVWCWVSLPGEPREHQSSDAAGRREDTGHLSAEQERRIWEAVTRIHAGKAPNVVETLRTSGRIH